MAPAPPAERRPRRGRLIGIIVLILVLLAAYTAYWIYARGQILASADAWIAEQRAAGYVIEHAGIGVGGFPYRFAVHVRSPHMEAPDIAGGWQVTLQGLRANALPYDFTHWIIDFQGPARYLGGEADARSLLLNAQRARASLGGGRRTSRLGLDIEGLEVAVEDGAAPLVRAAQRVRITARHDDDDVLRTRLQFEGLEFNATDDGADFVEGFGSYMSELRADLTVHNWPALARDGDAVAWGQTGGRVEMAEGMLRWGAINLTGAGDVSLDQRLQPRGRLSLTVINPEALANALVEGGFVTGDRERALRLAVQIAPRNEHGVSIPLVLREGGVFLGPVRIGHTGSLAD